jgi:cation diffusion facilitator CzcD-associated flavoprotein CzcO
LQHHASPQFTAWRSRPYDTDSAPLPTTQADLPVLVVGAGPAGLAAMSALREAAVAFQGVERHTGVGGIWDETNPVSSVYEGMLTATTRSTTHLTTPMPASWPHFVPFALAKKYLQDFAEREQLASNIRFGTQFLDARKTGSGTWNAAFRSNDGTPDTRAYRAIIIATGSHNLDLARIDRSTRAEAEGNGIHVIHSAEYREPSRHAGKRVLIVGAGASATDIAAKLSAVAARTIMSVRTSPWIIPASLLKWVPAVTGLGLIPDRLASDSARTPGRPRLAVAEAIVRLAAGDLRRFGLKRPRHRLLDRIPVLDRGILERVRSGQIIVRPEVAGVGPGVARFDGYPDEEIDELILATGFARSYPLLEESGEATLENVPRFYLFHPAEPGLAFMTECIGSGSAWPVFVEQGRAIAAYFAAEQRRGQNVAGFNARRGIPTPDFKGKVFGGADIFHIDYDLYTRALRCLVDWLKG